MLFRLQKKTPPPLDWESCIILIYSTREDQLGSLSSRSCCCCSKKPVFVLSPFWYLSWGSSQDTKSYPYLFIFPLFPTQIESSFRDWGLMNLCVSNYQHNVWHMEVFTYFSSELMKTTTYQLIKTSSHSV